MTTETKLAARVSVLPIPHVPSESKKSCFYQAAPAARQGNRVK
jgi:hypothetical protein